MAGTYAPKPDSPTKRPASWQQLLTTTFTPDIYVHIHIHKRIPKMENVLFLPESTCQLRNHQVSTHLDLSCVHVDNRQLKTPKSEALSHTKPLALNKKVWENFSLWFHHKHTTIPILDKIMQETHCHYHPSNLHLIKKITIYNGQCKFKHVDRVCRK